MVTDADLPAEGQLVVLAAPVTRRLLDLVRVTGRAERFDATAFDRYGLLDQQLVEPFGDVAVVAATAQGHPVILAAPT